MRGNPVIQWLVFLAAWFLLLIPVRYVTRPVVQVTEAATSLYTGDDADAVETWLSLRFSIEPTSFSVRQSDRVLWREDKPEGRQFERSATLVMDELGFEVVLEADLPAGAETAIELIMEPQGREVVRRTLWRKGGVAETVAFMWGRHD